MEGCNRGNQVKHRTSPKEWRMTKSSQILLRGSLNIPWLLALKHAILGSCLHQHMWKYYPERILYFQKCDMIASPKERDLVVNIHQFSLAGLPEARPSGSCQYFFPLATELEDSGQDSISASPHHFFLPLIPPSSSPWCRQRGRGQMRLLLLFWREIMSKINNLYRFNPNVSHKTISQSLDMQSGIPCQANTVNRNHVQLSKLSSAEQRAACRIRGG